MTKHMKPLVLAVLLVTATAACRRESAYKGPFGPEVNAAIPRIETAVGLKFKQMPKVEVRSPAQVRAYVIKEFTRPEALADFKGMESAYKRLGLIPDTLQLQKFLIDLLEEQIVGYYDPATKVLYIVEGSAKDAVGITVTHELIHALQDQYVSLDSVQKTRGNNDRQVASQAIFEGQAVYEQIAAMLGNNNVAMNMPGGWDRVRETIRENQSAMPIFAAAPLAIQESLIFPYLSGAEFVRNFKDRRPGTPLYGDVPVSTEQILHPAAYFARRDQPTTVELGAPATGTMTYENTLGEFETRLVLYEFLKDQNESVRGATGWDGDRFILVKTAQGEAFAWLTVWDSSVEAGEFYDLITRAAEKRFDMESAPTPAGKALSAKGRSILVSATEIQGRPVVIYTDVPAGASQTIIQTDRVKLTELPAPAAGN